MNTKSDERLQKYLVALEKTNKNLIVALKTMYKYSYTIEQTNKDLLNQLDNHITSRSMASFEKQQDESGVAYQLMELIMNMPEDDQNRLLEQLQLGILEQEVRDHTRKPFFMTIDYATHERSYNDFITDISAGGLFIETKRPFDIGQDITLSFPVPKYNKHFKIAAEIVRTTEKGVGVKFKKREPDQEPLTQSLLEMI